jgi:hypothetical protein
LAAEPTVPRPLIARFLSAGLALVLGAAALAADPRKTATAQPSASAKLVDVNKASRSELKTLPGIGDVEAAKIIGARPYLTKTDLVTKNVLTLQAYDALRSGIVVVHSGPPPKPKP